MEKGQHIASAFDRDLEALQATVMKMGGLVEVAIHDAARDSTCTCQNTVSLAASAKTTDHGLAASQFAGVLIGFAAIAVAMRLRILSMCSARMESSAV